MPGSSNSLIGVRRPKPGAVAGPPLLDPVSVGVPGGWLVPAALPVIAVTPGMTAVPSGAATPDPPPGRELAVATRA
jgi:hypothetical protein